MMCVARRKRLSREKPEKMLLRLEFKAEHHPPIEDN
jgi:hypothetical protein